MDREKLSAGVLLLQLLPPLPPLPLPPLLLLPLLPPLPLLLLPPLLLLKAPPLLKPPTTSPPSLLLFLLMLPSEWREDIPLFSPTPCAVSLGVLHTAHIKNSASFPSWTYVQTEHPHISI